MANEYAELGALKTARGIALDDIADDAALTTALTAASRAIDRKTGRRFWLDSTATARVYNPRSRITAQGLLLVDDIGSDSGLIVETGSGLSWTAVTEYDPSPDNATARGEAITGLSATGWGLTYGPDRVRVTAKWGWPAIPEEITMATLILANRLYLRKDTPEGVKGTADWGVIRLSRWDPDVESLVAPYVLFGFA